MEKFIEYFFYDFIETEPEFLRQLADALANPEQEEFLSKFIQLLGSLYAGIFALFALFLGFILFMICDVLYDLVPFLYKKIKAKFKQKKSSSEDSLFLVDDLSIELNKAKRELGEPDDKK